MRREREREEAEGGRKRGFAVVRRCSQRGGGGQSEIFPQIEWTWAKWSDIERRYRRFARPTHKFNNELWNRRRRGRREGVEHNERKRGRGRERAKRGMHSVQSAERGGVQTLCCRNGSVEILLGRLFYGSLDYDFTGLRFQYRRAPRRSSAQARVPDNRLSPRGDQFSGFSMFRYVVGRRGRGRAGLGRVEIRGCENWNSARGGEGQLE